MNRASVTVAFMLIATLLIFTPPTAEAATYTVDPQGGGTHTTIGAAFAAASPSDTIFVEPGVYVETGLLMGDITLESTGGPNATIIDGSAGGTILTINAAGATIRGFTLRDASGNGNIAISTTYSNLHLADMRFENNYQDLNLQGAGLRADNITSAGATAAQYFIANGGGYVSNLSMDGSPVEVRYTTGARFENLTLTNSSLLLDHCDSSLFQDIYVHSRSAYTAINLTYNSDGNQFQRWTVNSSEIGLRTAGAPNNHFDTGTVEQATTGIMDHTYDVRSFRNVTMHNFDLGIEWSGLANAVYDNITMEGQPFHFYSGLSHSRINNLTFDGSINYSNQGPLVVANSDNVTVENITSLDSVGPGLRMDYNDNLTLQDIDIRDPWSYGMHLEFITTLNINNVTSHGQTSGYHDGIYLRVVSDLDLADTSIRDISGQGLSLLDIDRGLLERLSIRDTFRGISTSGTLDAISMNQLTITDTWISSISLWNFGDIEITNSTFNGSREGIRAPFYPGSMVLENSSISNMTIYGIQSSSDCTCTLANNTVTQSDIGIGMITSGHVLRNNAVMGSTTYAFELDPSDPVEDFSGNTADGDPVVYHYQDTGVVVSDLLLDARSSNLGSVTLIESPDAIFSNLTLNGNSNGAGLYVQDSADFNASGITTARNGVGIHILEASGEIDSVNVTESSGEGVILNSSLGGVMRDSLLAVNGGTGLLLTDDSAGWLVYNNHFAPTFGPIIENNGSGNGFFVTPTTGPNIVEGFLIGGNYWADGVHVDADEDDFDDVIYEVNGSALSRDYYPLMAPLNQAPTVFFEATPNPAMAGQPVQFTDLSVDDGTVSSWTWDFGDGNTSSIQNPLWTYPMPGSYVVTLTVDDGLLQASTQWVLNVMSPPPPPIPPVASFTTQGTLEAGSAIQFISSSTDADGLVTASVWDFGDSLGSYLQSPLHTYATEGNYTVMLTVMDDEGLTHSTSQVLSIGPAAIVPPPPPPPIPSAGFAIVPATATTEDTVLFLPDDTNPSHIMRWSMDFGDGEMASHTNPGSARAISHMYVDPGTFTASLTITDHMNRTNSTSATITITDPPADPDPDPSNNDTAGETSDPASEAPWSPVQWGTIAGGFILLLLFQMLFGRRKKPEPAVDSVISDESDIDSL